MELNERKKKKEKERIVTDGKRFLRHLFICASQLDKLRLRFSVGGRKYRRWTSYKSS